MFKVGRLKELYVEVTSTCSLNCKHCSSLSSPSKNDNMDLLQLKKAIEGAYSLGMHELSISGGEPFLYKDLFHLVKYAKTKNIKVKLYSCGIFKKDKDISSIPMTYLKELKSLGIDMIIFSLYGSIPSTHEFMTNVGGSFEKTIKTIEKVNDIGINQEIHFVPTSKNFRELPQMIELAEYLKASQISLLRLVPQGRCLENRELLLSAEDIIEFKDITSKIKSEKVKVRKGAPFRTLFLHESSYCSAGVNKLYINALGYVFPCEAFKFMNLQSNIYNNEIEYIWNSDSLLNKLRNINYNRIITCRNCPNLENCQGGCPGQRLLKNGDIMKGPDPLCIIRKRGED